MREADLRRSNVAGRPILAPIPSGRLTGPRDRARSVGLPLPPKSLIRRSSSSLASSSLVQRRSVVGLQFRHRILVRAVAAWLGSTAGDALPSSDSARRVQQSIRLAKVPAMAACPRSSPGRQTGACHPVSRQSRTESEATARSHKRPSVDVRQRSRVVRGAAIPDRMQARSPRRHPPAQVAARLKALVARDVQAGTGRSRWRLGVDGPEPARPRVRGAATPGYSPDRTWESGSARLA